MVARIGLPLLCLLVLVSCVHPMKSVYRVQDLLIEKDTVWSGTILVSGVVTISRDAELKIVAGSRVLFVREDKDRDGLGDAALVVKGTLTAKGTEAAPILFASAEQTPQPGDWLEIRSDFARSLTFDWCEIRDSAYTVHAHFTRGHIRNSHIHRNIDGSRLGRSKFDVSNNLIERNQGKGINFRDSQVRLVANIIRKNRTGVFLFEKPGKSVIERNNIYANGMNLRLGDFFSDNVELKDNWWGNDSDEAIEKKVYDRSFDPEIGVANLTPSPGWHVDAGPVHHVNTRIEWSYPTEGFVDASPVVRGDRVAFVSWDGSLYLLSRNGQLQWKSRFDDVIDSKVANDDGFLYLQDWSRAVSRVSSADGQRETLFRYPQSPSDDHRQAGLVRHGNLLLVAAWNGTLFGYDLSTSRVAWEYPAGMPLRASPTILNDRIFQVSGSGLLSALAMNGLALWQRQFDTPLLSAPAATEDGIYLVDRAGKLQMLNLDGEQLWSYDTGEVCFYASPLISGGDVYLVTAGAGLWKFDRKTGAKIWRVSLAGPGYATPAMMGQMLIVGDNTGELAFFDKDSGRKVLSRNFGAALQAEPVVDGSRIYLGGRDRRLWSVVIDRPGKGDGGE